MNSVGCSGINHWMLQQWGCVWNNESRFCLAIQIIQTKIAPKLPSILGLWISSPHTTSRNCYELRHRLESTAPSSSSCSGGAACPSWEEWISLAMTCCRCWAQMKVCGFLFCTFSWNAVVTPYKRFSGWSTGVVSPLSHIRLSGRHFSGRHVGC